ncbi:MAG: thioredoxin-like domain-containing protein [Bacteroidota bacterium]|nr:thioredoxin-like domain-containing protein [Bacteroidota bacterium]
MLRGIISFITLILAAVTTAQDTDGCRISFDLAGHRDSYISLAYHMGNKQYIRDTLFTDKNGHAVYQEEEPLEKGLYMIVFPDNNLFELIISDDQKFMISCKKDDIINSLQFKGSKENSAFLAYRKKWIKFQEKATLYGQELNRLTNKDSINMLQEDLGNIEQEMLVYIKNTAEKYKGSLLSALLYSMLPVEIPDFKIPDNLSNKDSIRWLMGYNYNKNHFFDNINLDDPRLIRTPILHNKLRTFFSDVIIQAPDSVIPEIRKVISMAEGNPETFRYVLVFIFNHFRDSQIMGHDAVLVMLADEYYLNGRADWAGEKFLDDLKKDVANIRPSLIGKKAMNITMETFSGVWKSLYDIKSEFTILYFWEPNCGHCKTVTPKLRDIYSKYRDKGIEVFAVCTQNNREEWENYIIENRLEWINGWDPMRATSYDFYYNVRATPMLYILNKDKEIIAKKLPIDNVEAFIKNYRRMNP